MRRVRTFLTFFSLFVAALAPGSSSAQVANEEIKGFWQKGDAVNWRASVKATSSSSVVYRDYPLVVDAAKDRAQQPHAPASAQAPQNPAIPPENSQSTQSPPAHEPPLSHEQIVQRYGSPEQFSPIRAQKDAPLEMQGLFAALNAGDKELAWQYSVALARRNTEMQNMVSKATDYQLLAMESLGMRPPQEIKADTESVNPTRLELKELMEHTRQQELKRKLDIEQALQEEGSRAERGLAQLEAEARQASEIPVDPQGKVKVLVFFDEKDESRATVTNMLKPLRETFGKDESVSFVGLTKRSYALPALKKIGAASSFPFPLLNGEALAQELRIQSYPTVLFLAMSTKETYRIEGRATSEQVAKVIRVMKGQQ